MNDNTFFSIDRLIEFGLGMGVAQQMVQTMNHALQNTHIPGTQTPFLGQMAVDYHVMLDDKPVGPLNESELSRLIAAGKVRKETFVWRPGMVQWDKVENVADILKLVALAPPPFNPPNTSVAVVGDAS